MIEIQNEFMTPGGKLHEQVRPVMEEINFEKNCVELVAGCRKLGCVQVMYAPISFAPDGSDNPNRHLGILSGVEYDDLFQRGSWNAQIAESMLDPAADNDDIVIIEGKRGLSAFVNTDLAEQLAKHNCDTIALGGFMANCCVESTMRDAFDRGFNVITLTDCVATTTMRGYKSCVEITYPFFSTPMNSASFLACVRTAMKFPEVFKLESWQNTEVKLNLPTWASRHFVADSSKAQMVETDLSRPIQSITFDQTEVYQMGPWHVDVRQSAIGEKIVSRTGEHELKRYLSMAQATGAFEGNSYWEPGCDCIFTGKLKEIELAKEGGEDTSNSDENNFGWLCNMAVIRLPKSTGGGCLLYSPVLGPDSKIESVHASLAFHRLLPVRVVIFPSPQHHLAAGHFQSLFPDAFYICGRASGQMSSLTKKRRDIRFDGRLKGPGRVCDGVLSQYFETENNGETPIMDPSEIPLAAHHPKGGGHDELMALWKQIASSSENDHQGVFDVCVLDDNRTG